MRGWQLALAMAGVLAAAAPLWAGSSTLDVRVNSSSNDATENSGGSMNLTDAELKFEYQTWMGLRFNNVTIPRGAYIVSAYVTFRASASASPTTTPTIYGHDTDNASTFTTSSTNISGRSRTSASVSWSMSSWTSGTNYNSPEIKSIVSEIVSRSGWSSGNSLALVINTPTSGADRKSYSYNGSTTLAPLLHVEYIAVAAPVATRLLFVVTSSSSPSSQESTRKTMFENLGYTVTLLTASSSQASYDTAAAANDLAYISEEISSTDVNTKLKSKPLGIVNEEVALADDFAIASASSSPSGTAVSIVKNNHYITSAFAVGSLTVTNSSQPLNTYLGTIASGNNMLATIGGVNALMAIEAGGALSDGTRAAGRRVSMPWGGGSFDFGTLSPDGIELLSRTLAWAGGLVGWWKLDETTGTSATDSSVNVKHGTLSGTTFAASSTTGQVGGGLSFDGADDSTTIPNASVFQMTQALSISAWIRGDSWGSGSYVNSILRKGTTNPNNWQLAIENGTVGLALDGNDGSNVHGNTVLQTGTWYHVVGSWDGTNIRIYVNGTLDHTPAARAAPINTDTRSVYLGGRSGTDYFDGVLDDVRLYNHALQPSEIGFLHSQGIDTGVRIIKWVELP